MMAQRYVKNRPEIRVRIQAHDDLCRILSPEQRAWLAKMSDVLPFGWVIVGMAHAGNEAVVRSDEYPNGMRLVGSPRFATGGWIGQEKVR